MTAAPRRREPAIRQRPEARGSARLISHRNAPGPTGRKSMVIHWANEPRFRDCERARQGRALQRQSLRFPRYDRFPTVVTSIQPALTL